MSAPVMLSRAKICNGNNIIVLRQPVEYFSTTTSLPTLPGYCESGSGRRRWGEDEDIERAGFDVCSSGFARLRQNVDGCHPVEESLDQKYEAYMFPKVMTQNINKFPYSPFSTLRHVPRKPSFQVFPRNSETRMSPEGLPILGNGVRRSIARNKDHLYRTTAYRNTFPDTTEHIKRRIDRDLQYVNEGPTYIEQQTCSRAVTHPDPCPHCWPGRKAKPKEPFLVSLRKGGNSEFDYDCHTVDDLESFSRYGRPDCRHKNHCHGKRTSLMTSDYTPDDNDVYEFHGNDDLLTDFQHWSSVDGRSLPTERGRLSMDTPTKKQFLEPLSDRYVMGSLERLNRQQDDPLSTRSLGSRNSWTYRDDNNLRLPSVAEVIGTLDKTEAQRRYHQEHPDPVPDLRDNKRYSKRVNFFGFNSSVYR